MSFHGRIAAVSGAGGPMGRAVIDRLVEGGIGGVALTDISSGRLNAAVSALPRDLSVSATRADATIPDEAAQFANDAMAELGQVDMLVNVVGGLRTAQLYTPFLEISPVQWRATMDLNLLSAVLLSQAFAPGMLERGWGRIVNITSIVMGGECGQADYAASKAAVASLTRSMAAEFAPNVTVNCVAPGLTRSSITANIPADQQGRLTGQAFHPRMAEPAEVADAIAYFLTGGARFVTGEMLSVSGGIRPHL